MTITHIVKHNPVTDAITKIQLIITKRVSSCKGHLMIYVFNVNCHSALTHGMHCKIVKINTRSDYPSIRSYTNDSLINKYCLSQRIDSILLFVLNMVCKHTQCYLVMLHLYSVHVLCVLGE